MKPTKRPVVQALACGGLQSALGRPCNQIAFRIFKGERQYVAECLDLPVVTQAPTLAELAYNLHEAISLHLDDEDLADLVIVDEA